MGEDGGISRSGVSKRLPPFLRKTAGGGGDDLFALRQEAH